MKKKILSNILPKVMFIVVSIATIALSFANTGSNIFTPIAIASLIELATFLIMMKIVTGKFVDFGVIFISILYLFHFGQLILLGLFERASRDDELRIVLDYIPTNECAWAMRIMNIAFVAMCFGILLKSKKSIRKKIFSQIKITDNSFRQYFKQALFMIAITFPIKLAIDSIYLYISITQGFVAGRTWYSELIDIPKTIGNFSLIGFGLLLLILRDRPKKQTILMIAIGLYFCLLMSTGRRSENVAYLCTFIFIYLKSNTMKISLWRIILYGALGYVLLAFLFTVVDMREQAHLTPVAFFEGLVTNLTGNNIVFEALREYGNTGYTAVCVLCFWLTKFSPSYGKSYLLGLSAIFPNIGGLMGKLSTESAYALKLQEYNTLTAYYQNIGGSFVGELFFNFGVVGGIIAALIAGLCFGAISTRINKHLNSGAYNRLIKYIPVMTGSLFWIRDSFQGGIREAVWGILFCLLVAALFKNKGVMYAAKKESTYCSR